MESRGLALVFANAAAAQQEPPAWPTPRPEPVQPEAAPSGLRRVTLEPTPTLDADASRPPAPHRGAGDHGGERHRARGPLRRRDARFRPVVSGPPDGQAEGRDALGDRRHPAGSRAGVGDPGDVGIGREASRGDRGTADPDRGDRRLGTPEGLHDGRPDGASARDRPGQGGARGPPEPLLRNRSEGDPVESEERQEGRPPEEPVHRELVRRPPRRHLRAGSRAAGSGRAPERDADLSATRSRSCSRTPPTSGPPPPAATPGR